MQADFGTSILRVHMMFWSYLAIHYFPTAMQNVSMVPTQVQCILRENVSYSVKLEHHQRLIEILDLLGSIGWLRFGMMSRHVQATLLDADIGLCAETGHEIGKMVRIPRLARVFWEVFGHNQAINPLAHFLANLSEWWPRRR